MEINNVQQKNLVSKFFDTSDSWKGTLYKETNNHFNRSMLRRKTTAFELLKNVGALHPGSSLDIGCGCGIYSEELEQYGYKTYGIDLSEQMIDICRAKFNSSKSNFLVADIESIPFGNETFDLVLCVGVFGYLLDDAAALKEVARVIKPGGYFFISVQNIMSLSNFDYIVRKKFSPTKNKSRRNGDTAAIPVPWVISNSSTHLFYKSYFPRKLEQVVEQYGFTFLKSCSLGYEFRLARRYHLLPEAVLNRMEELCEKAARTIPLSLVKYSGDTFSAVFKKNI